MKFVKNTPPKGLGRDRVLRPVPSIEKGKSGLKVALQARAVLADRVARGSPREQLALELLKKELGERGGSLEVVTSSTGAKMVVGQVRVDAGPVTKEKMVAVGRNGQLSTEVLKETKGIDEEVVSKAKGFGAGALDVSYRVDENGAAEYVLQTNGSRACVEKNLVNVAMALVGAAEIVEEMLKPADAASDVVKLKDAKAA
jgi:hypothetical protein